MPRVPLSPPIGREGIYVVNAPYVLDTTTIFRCESQRMFPDLVRKGTDVYKDFYAPVGLTKEIYAEDAALGAAIITLKSADGQLVDVPSTYIAAIPGQTGMSYQRNVLTADLGPVPGYVDVTQIEAEIKAVIGRYIGVNAEVLTTTLKYEGEYTDAEHIQMENLRKLNVRDHIPASVTIAELEARNARLTELNTLLMQVVTDGGLTPPTP